MSTDDEIDKYLARRAANGHELERELEEAEDLGDYWDACFNYIGAEKDNVGELLEGLIREIRDFEKD